MAEELSLVLSAEASHHTSLPAIPNIISEACPPTYSLQPSVLGGYLSSGSQLVWRAFGPTVEVLNSSNGTRVAAWTFGAILRSMEAKVLSVCGVGQAPGVISHIVCGVDRGPEASPRGLAAVLSLNSSKIVRAFLFPNAVVQVCPITGGTAWVDACTLHPSLRHCSPLVVIATNQPSLHLLDLALDVSAEIGKSDEVNPASLVSLPLTSCSSTSVLQHRLSALRERLHFSTTILEGSVSSSRFSLLGPNDAVLCQLPVEAVAVTSLLYIPQIASLAVGYNFGAFQLYNIRSMAIDCTSPYEEGVPGVISFAYQEPENDPRNCVYLWLCRSNAPSDFQSSESGDGGAVCTLYSMTYEKREWIEGHGLSYQGLSSISPRFEFEADGSPSCWGSPEGGGATVLFTCHTITRPTPPSTPPPLANCPPSLLLSATDEEGSSSLVSDLSLCLFGWYSRTSNERGRSSIQHYVALFDINQWYQAQMPGSARLTTGKMCPYMSFHRLDRVPCGTNERVLAAAPLTTSNIVRHMAPSGSSERDWYPASLSYGVGVLSSSGCAWYQCRSSQRACLRWLLAQGPAAVLMCPQDAVARCSFAGLSGEHDFLSPRLDSKKSEREIVLDTCLSQHLLSVLSECVSEFSEGRFAGMGCTLPSFLHWAWSKVTDTKADTDALLLRLFSCGDAQLTPEQLQRLHHNLNVLGSLRTLLALCAQHTPITTKHAGGGRGEVSAYSTVVTLLHQHLTVTLWFQHCQLLPEVDPSLAMEDSSAVPYPALNLAQIYQNRRQEIRELSPNLEGTDLLMIDLLIEELGVKNMNEWGEGCPVYPPQSLQALLDLYLLADVDLSLKHRIVQYLFLDLSSILSDGFSSAVEQLIKFPASAKLSPSIIKLTQAFWLLDQKDFQSAVDLFLDPLVVRTDITTAQHRRIIRALLCQNEAYLALRYYEGRKPPHQELEDVQLQLSVLLANGRVREAFHYQRNHATVANHLKLLLHLLQGCEFYGLLHELLQLPLSAAEENAFLDFLRDSEQPLAKHILTVACLRNFRYNDAGSIGLAEDKQKQAARTALLHCYSAHLQPNIVPTAMKEHHNRYEYSAKQPLSACLRQAALSPVTKAKSFRDRLAFAQDKLPTEPFTPFRSRLQRQEKRTVNDLSKSECSLLFPSRVLEKSRAADSTASASTRGSILANVSAHITGLLSTPPAPRRARPSFLSRAPSVNGSTAASTPQSILKVRSLLKRPMSPCSSSGDLSVPPPPRSSTRPVVHSKVLLEEDGEASDSSCLTPKQLRFALPSPPPQETSSEAPTRDDVTGLTKIASDLEKNGEDSDDISDLDVQLEPYINKRASMDKTTALYEEQESWELIGDQSLPTEMPPSFTGVLQRVSADETVNRSQVELDSKRKEELDKCPVDEDEDSVLSGINEHFFSFESEEQDESQAGCHEQETDVLKHGNVDQHRAEYEVKDNTQTDFNCEQNDNEKLIAQKSCEPFVTSGYQEEETRGNEPVELRAPRKELDDTTIGDEIVDTCAEEVSSVNQWLNEPCDTVPILSSATHNSCRFLVEEQSSQDATRFQIEGKNTNFSSSSHKISTSSHVLSLNEITAEEVESCLLENATTSTGAFSVVESTTRSVNEVLVSSKRRRRSSSSESEGQEVVEKPPSKTAKFSNETRQFTSVVERETIQSLHFSDDENDSNDDEPNVEDKDAHDVIMSQNNNAAPEQIVLSPASIHDSEGLSSSTASKKENSTRRGVADESHLHFTEIPLTRSQSPISCKVNLLPETQPFPVTKVQEGSKEVINALHLSSSDESSDDTDSAEPIREILKKKSNDTIVSVEQPLHDKESSSDTVVQVSENSKDEYEHIKDAHSLESSDNALLKEQNHTSVPLLTSDDRAVENTSESLSKVEPSEASIRTPRKVEKMLVGINPSNIINTSYATPLRRRRRSDADASLILDPPSGFTDSVSLRSPSRRYGAESPLIAKDGNRMQGLKTTVPPMLDLSSYDKTDLEPIFKNTDGEENIVEVDCSIPCITTSDASALHTSDGSEEKKSDGEIKKADSSAVDSKIIDKIVGSLDEDSELAVRKSPARRGRRSSIDGVTDLLSPATPLRRSSRRSVTPSKFGTPVLESVPEVSEKKTPVKRILKKSHSTISDDADKSITSIFSDQPSSDVDEAINTPLNGRRGRRKSIDSGTPIASPAATPSTPVRRSRRVSATIPDPLQVIAEEIAENIQDETATATPSKTLIKSQRKSRRSMAVPDLQPIPEDEKLATVFSLAAKTTQSTQKMTSDTGASVSKNVDLSVENSSMKPIKMLSLGNDYEIETGIEEKVRGRRRSSSSRRTSREAPFGRGIIAMTLHSTDTSEDENPIPVRQRRRSKWSSELSANSSIISIPKKPSSDSEEEDESIEEHPEELGVDDIPIEDIIPNEEEPSEEVPAKGTKLRNLRHWSPVQSSADELRKPSTSRRRSSAMSVGGSSLRVGLKRSRESFKLVSSEPEIEKEDQAPAVMNSKKKRKSGANN
ncbi:protein ELYS [Hyalella azteca]|uniref:Protein ELYS n=1 Tax=Hyalella azteca TaxID=294128 RepID=A0A8B7PHL0_HYAAZ|nr:protein ELYS [Hyalella azteca]